MIRDFFHELRRRNVFKSMATYLLVAWLVVQVLDVIGPALGMTERFMTYTIVSLAVGFPIVALVSWFFELTTSGLRLETDEPLPAEGRSGSIFNYVIIAMLAAALGVSLLTRDKLTTVPEALQSLAVLPLDNFGARDDDGFVLGLHDDLLTVLSRIDSLRVISRSSVLQFAGDKPSVREIGRRLGTRTILEGSVQRSNGRIRVNVQLIDAENDDHIWAQVFERAFDANAIFTIQREIAQAIAARLRIALSGDDLAELEREPTGDVEAYSAYLLGRQRMEKRTSDALEEAEAFFRRAIDHDPGYADAWAGLAHALNLQHTYASLPLDDMLRQAMPAVQRALELNPSLSTAHAVLGDLRGYTRDVKGAEASFKTAIELNPNNALPRHLYGSMLYSSARMQEALVQHSRALELDPLSVTISNSLAQDLLALGRSKEAADQYRKSLEIEPEFAATYAHLSQLERFAFGRPDRAVRWLNKAFGLDPRHSEYAALIGEASLELDDREAAARWSALAMETAPGNYWPARVALLVALRSGDTAAIEHALDHYESHLGPAWITLMARRDLYLQRGDLDGARQLFLGVLPEFFESPAVVDQSTFYLAPALVVVHQMRGEDDRAEALLEKVRTILADMRASGYEDFDLTEVEVLALAGETQRAIEVLEAGASNDWLSLWWYIEQGRNLQALHDKPRFAAVFDRVRRRMHELRDALEPEYRLPPAVD